MVVAVTYEDGNVGEHFGHAKNFKLYELEDGRIIDSAVIQPVGSGHAAVVADLVDYNTSMVICNSIGETAMDDLRANGILLCSGVTGKADDVVAAFMEGSLEFSTEGGCSHHGEGHSCCGAAGSCGAAGGCGASGSCCH